MATKCDERHPVCGPCFRGDRSCSYTYGKPRAFVAFVDRTKPAENPQGGSVDGLDAQLFPRCQRTAREQPRRHQMAAVDTLSTSTSVLSLTYGSYPSGSVRGGDRAEHQVGYAGGQSTIASPDHGLSLSPWQPSLEGDSLVLRWKQLGELVCPNEPEPYNLHEWGEELPQWLGHCRALDLALDCFISGTMFALDGKRQHYNKAQIQLNKSLSNIREAIIVEDCRMIQDMILLAIDLVTAAEVRYSPSTYTLDVKHDSYLQIAVLKIRLWKS